jgi:hypothetical protein
MGNVRLKFSRSGSAEFHWEEYIGSSTLSA